MAFRPIEKKCLIVQMSPCDSQSAHEHNSLLNCTLDWSHLENIAEDDKSIEGAIREAFLVENTFL